jgi:hypothetical protein
MVEMNAIAQKRRSNEKALEGESKRYNIAVFLVIITLGVLLSFKGSRKLQSASTKLTARIRYEQSRTELMMMKRIANYSARLDAAWWKKVGNNNVTSTVYKFKSQVAQTNPQCMPRKKENPEVVELLVF